MTNHSWRHFFNTYLLAEDVSDAKVMAVTGHVTKKMKEHYTHFDTSSFVEVMAAQQKLMEHRGRKKAGAGTGEAKQTERARGSGVKKTRAKSVAAK